MFRNCTVILMSVVLLEYEVGFLLFHFVIIPLVF